MKVFISWSGTRSKHIATALRDWLPNVLQSVRPFISSQDILKGARGNVQITKELETAAIGIICLTPENLLAPWILFEAGALSKLSSAYVCTYLYDLDPSDISPPLGQFQHTKSSKEETFALVQTINAELPDGTGLDADRLKEAFDVWWKRLQSQLKSVPDKPDDEASPPERSDDDKLDELLKLVRMSFASTSAMENHRLSEAPWNRPANKPGEPSRKFYKFVVRVDELTKNSKDKLIKMLSSQSYTEHGRSTDDGTAVEVDIAASSRIEADLFKQHLCDRLDELGRDFEFYSIS